MATVIQQSNLPSPQLLKLVEEAAGKVADALGLSTKEVCWQEHEQLEEALSLLSGFSAGFTKPVEISRIKDLPFVGYPRSPENVKWRKP